MRWVPFLSGILESGQFLEPAQPRPSDPSLKQAALGSPCPVPPCRPPLKPASGHGGQVLGDPGRRSGGLRQRRHQPHVAGHLLGGRAESHLGVEWLGVGPQLGAHLPLSFSGEGSPTKIDYGKKGYPYSDLSTGGPSLL